MHKSQLGKLFLSVKPQYQSFCEHLTNISSSHLHCKYPIAKLHRCLQSNPLLTSTCDDIHIEGVQTANGRCLQEMFTQSFLHRSNTLLASSCYRLLTHMCLWRHSPGMPIELTTFRVGAPPVRWPFANSLKAFTQPFLYHVSPKTRVSGLPCYRLPQV